MIPANLPAAAHEIWTRLEAACREEGYGNFAGGDPREFRPDPDSSSEEERAAHAADCLAWQAWQDAGSVGAPPGHSVKFGRELSKLPGGEIASVSWAGYGHGSYYYLNPEVIDAAEALVAALTAPTIYWDVNSPEVGLESLEDLADYADLSLGKVVEVSLGRDVGHGVVAALMDPTDRDALVYKLFPKGPEAQAAADASRAEFMRLESLEETPPPVAPADPTTEHFARRFEAPPE